MISEDRDYVAIPANVFQGTIRSAAPVIPKGDLAYLFQLKRDALISILEDYRDSVEADTLGDYSELGFLTNILQALIED